MCKDANIEYYLGKTFLVIHNPQTHSTYDPWGQVNLLQ